MKKPMVTEVGPMISKDQRVSKGNFSNKKTEFGEAERFVHMQI